MKVELEIIPGLEETEIRIRTEAISDELQDLIGLLQSAPKVRPILGVRNHKTILLKPAGLIRIFSENGAVFADTDQGLTRLKMRLYEAEELLPARQFIRISKSEIVNIEQIESFDLSMSGTILIQMKNGAKAWVSRRYVSRVREAFGL